MQKIKSPVYFTSSIYFVLLLLCFPVQSEEISGNENLNSRFNSYLDNSWSNRKTTGELDGCLVIKTIEWLKNCNSKDQIYRREFIMDLSEVDLNSATKRAIKNTTLMRFLYSEDAEKRNNLIEEEMRVFEGQKEVSSLPNWNFEKALVLTEKIKELLKKENISTMMISSYCSGIVLTSNQPFNTAMAIKENAFNPMLSLLKKQKQLYCTKR